MYKKALIELLKREPSANLVENRYKVMLYVLSKRKLWNDTLFAHLENFAIYDLLKEVIYIDRQIRKETEGKDIENKEILSQEYQIKELGVEIDPLKESFEQALNKTE